MRRRKIERESEREQKKGGREKEKKRKRKVSAEFSHAFSTDDRVVNKYYANQPIFLSNI